MAPDLASGAIFMRLHLRATLLLRIGKSHQGERLSPAASDGGLTDTRKALAHLF